MNCKFCTLLTYDWELHSCSKFRNKNGGCCSCVAAAASQQWTWYCRYCRYCCYSWFMWHWLICKALFTGNIQRPYTFNYYLNNLTIIPSTDSTLHRFWELRNKSIREQTNKIATEKCLGFCWFFGLYVTLWQKGSRECGWHSWTTYDVTSGQVCPRGC
jgi:hypothetical protein